MTRRDMRREATKAAVLEAAEKVFLSQGYEGATIKAIADEAGVSPGTVLNAEPSKAALLMAILSNEVEIIAESVEQMEAALSGNLADRIIALMQIMLEGQSRNSELFAAAVGHSWMVADPTYQASLDEMELAWRPLRRILEAGIADGELRQDVDVDTLIAVLTDLFLGAMRASRRSEYEERSIIPLEARVRVVIEGMLAR